MSTAITRSTGAPLDGFLQLPAQRQVGLLLTLAVAVGLLGAAFTWATRPSMVPVLAGLDQRDTAAAMDALTQNGFDYELDGASGRLLVPASRLHEARIRLATEGLPRASTSGLENFGRDAGFGTSRMVETARYHHALEGELARSIMTLQGVESARVHLALPRPSVFVRDRATPTASVLVNLHPGRVLNEAQAAGIVHLVASSIPQLEADKVTVVDQRGRLLTSPGDSANAGLSGRDLDYVERLEESYVERISELLTPMLGADGFRAQVAAKVDFTQVESTRESFDPDSVVLRSEQVSEDLNTAASGAMGVPGALSNQPPARGEVMPGGAPRTDAQASGQAGGQAGGQSEGPDAARNSSRRSTRNFEMDRTVSHVREAGASLDRLSVAVVVDHRPAGGDAGERTPLSEEELGRISTLVREAVGFDAERGDSVNVVSASFMAAEAPAPLEALPLWREPWVADAAKQAVLGLLALIVLPLVMRPLLKNLSAQPARRPMAALPAGGAVPQVGDASPPGLPAAQGSARKPSDDGDDALKVAQNMVREDPKRVAQVVKQWVASDGNQ